MKLVARPGLVVRQLFYGSALAVVRVVPAPLPLRESRLGQPRHPVHLLRVRHRVELGHLLPHGRRSPSNSDLTPEIFTAFIISSVTQLTEDTYQYTFKLPGNSSLGLSLGQHIVLRGVVNGLEVQRAYTPITPVNAEGFFEVLIKCYKTGLMSQYIKSWKTETPFLERTIRRFSLYSQSGNIYNRQQTATDIDSFLIFENEETINQFPVS
ncbi:hypothetical protein E2320_010287 [Naja naja]|nr:hypothetical protein E2320_010287 [Naja naja]